MKKNNEENEKKLCSHKPKINKKSQELASKNKGDFYERQKKLMDDKKKKDALLKEKIQKKEYEEINKNNILLTRNKANKEKKKKERKKSMDDVVKNFYEWDSKRKEKLNDKIKTKEKNIKKDLRKKPQINKNSYLITVNRNPDQIFNRLYIDDINKRKERQQMLEHIYTPSFQPNLVNIKNPKKRNKNLSSYKNGHLNTMSYNSVRSNYRSNLDSEEENDFEDIHDDVEICALIRSHIFRKVKNKTRYNTSENLNFKKSESAKEYILNKKNENNRDNDNDEDDDSEEKKEIKAKKYMSPNPAKKNNNKIKIKKNYEYLMTEHKNRNRSGYL